MSKGKVKTVILPEMKRTRVIELVCEGKTMTEVAGLVGITQGRVTQIMSQVRAEWAAKREIATGDYVEIQLARLKEVYLQAEEGWQSSRQDGVTVLTRKVRPRQEKGDKGELGRRLKKADQELLVVTQEETRKGQAGDPSFLKVKADVINTSLKLLGAFPKEDKNETTNVIQINWSDLANPIPSREVITITPSSEIEARIASELGNMLPKNSNGNGHL